MVQKQKSKTKSGKVASKSKAAGSSTSKAASKSKTAGSSKKSPAKKKIKSAAKKTSTSSSNKTTQTKTKKPVKKAAAKKAVKKKSPAVTKTSTLSAKAKKTSKKSAGKASSKTSPLTPVKISKKDQKLMAENEKRWEALQNRHQDPPLDYDSSKSYLPKVSIKHPIFGWGYILSVRNKRLEVIFKDSVKYLASEGLGA